MGKSLLELSSNPYVLRHKDNTGRHRILQNMSITICDGFCSADYEFGAKRGLNMSSFWGKWGFISQESRFWPFYDHNVLFFSFEINSFRTTVS